MRNKIENEKKGEENLQSLLLKKFEKFTIKNLQGIDAEKFRSIIESHINEIDADIEGYKKEEIEKQRDLSIKFHWGHNHNFGSFSLKGRMGERHINVLTRFIELYPISIETFKNKDVFDIGCWTGGTTLMLNALETSSVTAIEEVKKYASMVNFLIDSFGIGKNTFVKNLSLYSCNSDDFKNKFDIAFFPGVIYHLSDPVVALRILYNSLKLDGIILIESAGLNSDLPRCIFEGNEMSGGNKEELNRGGWNWFLPSPSALARMMREAGFAEIETNWDKKSQRVYGFARKNSQVGICKAGLSVQNID